MVSGTPANPASSSLADTRSKCSNSTATIAYVSRVFAFVLIDILATYRGILPAIDRGGDGGEVRRRRHLIVPPAQTIAYCWTKLSPGTLQSSGTHPLPSPLSQDVSKHFPPETLCISSGVNSRAR